MWSSWGCIDMFTRSRRLITCWSDFVAELSRLAVVLLMQKRQDWESPESWHENKTWITQRKRNALHFETFSSGGSTAPVDVCPNRDTQRRNKNECWFGLFDSIPDRRRTLYILIQMRVVDAYFFPCLACCLALWDILETFKLLNSRRSSFRFKYIKRVSLFESVHRQFVWWYSL